MQAFRASATTKFFLRMRRNILYRRRDASIAALPVQILHQRRKGKKVFDTEGRAARRDPHEAIFLRNACPGCGNAPNAAVNILVEDAVKAPAGTSVNQTELPAMKGVERMRDPDKCVCIVRIGSNRRSGPNGKWRATCAQELRSTHMQAPRPRKKSPGRSSSPAKSNAGSRPCRKRSPKSPRP